MSSCNAVAVAAAAAADEAAACMSLITQRIIDDAVLSHIEAYCDVLDECGVRGLSPPSLRVTKMHGAYPTLYL